MVPTLAVLKAVQKVERRADQTDQMLVELKVDSSAVMKAHRWAETKAVWKGILKVDLKAGQTVELRAALSVASKVVSLVAWKAVWSVEQTVACWAVSLVGQTVELLGT